MGGKILLPLILIAWIDQIHGLNISPRNPQQTVGNAHLSHASCGILPKVKIRDREGFGESGSGISSFGQIPWQVGIFHKPGSTLICSGVLLSSDLVLTSAICLLAVESFSDLEIRLGDWDISDKDARLETYEHFTTSVANVILYPDVPVGTNHPTAALLRLKDQVDFHSYPHIAPICLPPVTVSLDKGFPDKCYVSGWGSQNEDIMAIAESSQNQNLFMNETKSDIKRPDKTLTNDNIKIASKTQINSNWSRFSFHNNERSNENASNSLENIIKFHDVPSSLKYTPSSHNSEPHTLTRLPDPVEDYFDEEPDNMDIISPESPDITIPILDHHEANVYKHKLKYKKGKMIYAKHRKQHQRRNADSHTQRQVKRSSYKKKRRIQTDEKESKNANLLKLFQIQIHNKCPASVSDQHISDENLSKPPKSQFCITPQRGPNTLFACMLDVGSPVFCTIDTVSDQLSRQENTEKPTTKTYLFGMVSSWTPRCQDLLKVNQIEPQSQYNIEPLSELLRNFAFNNM